jgi:hypothetical protein
MSNIKRVQHILRSYMKNYQHPNKVVKKKHFSSQEITDEKRPITFCQLVVSNGQKFSRIYIPKTIDGIATLLKPKLNTPFQCYEFDYMCTIDNNNKFCILPSYVLINYNTKLRRNTWIRISSYHLVNDRSACFLLPKYDLSTNEYDREIISGQFLQRLAKFQ